MQPIYILFAFLIAVFAVPRGDSVSGLSSGAYFATQYQVAFSSQIVGAGIFAGGPYYCAMGEVGFALTACMSDPFLISLEILEDDAKNFASNGSIDDPANLAKHKVFIFSGQNDRTVYPAVVQKLEQMYRDLGVTKITTNYTSGAGHSFPTVNYGTECGTTQSPYITNCNYDGAGAALQTIYGKLNPPVNPVEANLQKMSISPFVPNGASAASLSLDDTVYYYQPASCKGNCSVHVAFAGCEMTISDVGIDFVQGAGYNGWAESNGIVVVYPFTIRSTFEPMNMEGCWDWWSYSSPQYAQNTGPQLVTIKNLIASFHHKSH